MRDRASGTGTVEAAYKSLYKLGSVAALMVVLLTVGEIIGFTFYPQPGTVSEWFTLFQSNKILGWMVFWGLEVPMYMMFTIVFLALYVVLREVDRGLMTIAVSFALVGMGVFLATNNPFTMLSISNQYAAATTDAQRSILLAAGEAVLAHTGQRAVGGFNVALFLVTIAGLLFSSAMFRTPLFKRLTAYVGILAYTLSLVDYVRQLLTSSAIIALLVIIPNALALVAWFILVGRKLHQLGDLEEGAPFQEHPT